MNLPLQNQVALVAGATRGAGRAIALELALAGATVYATGRSSRGARSGSDKHTGTDTRAVFDLSRRPETIEETAELIRAAGGSAFGLRVDHSREAEVRALIERIAREHGRLDILINDVYRRLTPRLGHTRNPKRLRPSTSRLRSALPRHVQLTLPGGGARAHEPREGGQPGVRDR